MAFLSTPSGWRATQQAHRAAGCAEFLSTPSGWRATVSQGGNILFIGISIHALRVEGDLEEMAELRVEGDLEEMAEEAKVNISIHALRVEGDIEEIANDPETPWISIHALRVEGDDGKAVPLVLTAVFLSTPSGWRATPSIGRVIR